MLSFIPRGVLDEILNLIESVSEGFPSYSSIAHSLSLSSVNRPDMTEILMKRTGRNIACHLSSIQLKIEENAGHVVRHIIGGDFMRCAVVLAGTSC